MFESQVSATHVDTYWVDFEQGDSSDSISRVVEMTIQVTCALHYVKSLASDQTLRYEGEWLVHSSRWARLCADIPNAT